MADRTHERCRFYDAFGEHFAHGLGKCDWTSCDLHRPPWFQEQWCDRLVTGAEVTGCPCFEARKDEASRG